METAYANIILHQQEVGAPLHEAGWSEVSIADHDKKSLQATIATVLEDVVESNMKGPGVREKVVREAQETWKKMRSYLSEEFGKKYEKLGELFAVNEYEKADKIAAALVKHGRQENKERLWLRTVKVTLFVEEGRRFMDVPVFCVCNTDTHNPYTTAIVDGNGRIYVNWKDFLDSNVFPACTMCCLKDGVYTMDEDGRFVLEFHPSPSNKTLHKVVDVIEFLLNLADLACLVLPIPLPISVAIFVIARLFGLIHLSVKLYDRWKHGESIGTASWKEWALIILNLVSIGLRFNDLRATFLLLRSFFQETESTVELASYLKNALEILRSPLEKIFESLRGQSDWCVAKTIGRFLSKVCSTIWSWLGIGQNISSEVSENNKKDN